MTSTTTCNDQKILKMSDLPHPVVLALGGRLHPTNLDTNANRVEGMAAKTNQSRKNKSLLFARTWHIFTLALAALRARLSEYHAEKDDVLVEETEVATAFGQRPIIRSAVRSASMNRWPRS